MEHLPESGEMDMDKSISDFAGRIGVAHKTVITLMKGERGTTKYVIDLILKETGMTYEKCFEEK